MARPRKPPLGRVRDAALTRLEYARRAGRGTAQKRVVAILGMHRSGTSAVAGTLQEAGLYLGSILRKHESNQRGTREHLGIVALHEEILAHSGGSWRDPPSTITWTQGHRERRDRILASFDDAELWGFKDPRTVLLLDFWREALGDSLQLVGVFREPSAVVKSLLSRNGGTSGEWLALWVRYNLRLLQETQATRSPLIEFMEDEDDFLQQVLPVVRALGLHAVRRRHFYRARLIHIPTDAGLEIPEDAADVYDRLRRQCRSFEVLSLDSPACGE